MLLKQKNSIYRQFYQKLIIATTIFLSLLAVLLYSFTKTMFYEEIKANLIKDAQLIKQTAKSSHCNSKFKLANTSNVFIDIVQNKTLANKIYFTEYKDP